MTIALLFWILMILWLLSYFAQAGGWGGPYGVWGFNLLLFILLLLLGWGVFGAPIKGGGTVAWEINKWYAPSVMEPPVSPLALSVADRA
jgi:hypothetical protein